MKTPVSGYAFFDFDGTLISQDSFRVLLEQGLKQQPARLLLLVLFLPLFLLTTIFRLEKRYAKSALLWSLTVGKGKRNAIRFLRQSVVKNSKDMWFQEATPILRDLKSAGVDIVIVTASGQTWVRALVSQEFRECRLIIGSKLTFFAGGVVLASKNCYGAEKLLRIEKLLGSNLVWHSAWSDHTADILLLGQAPERHLVRPKKKHLPLFIKVLGQECVIHDWHARKP